MTRLELMAPLVWTRPAPDSPEAFREDEFVSLWCDMYALLLKLNFWRREDIIFPPTDTGRHVNLDSQRLLNMGMTPDAVSLLERLPYPRFASYKRMRIFPEAIFMNYSEEDDVKDCRDPHDMAQYSTQESSTSDGSYLQPQDVTLARPDESDGVAWILDLDYNAFRFIPGILEAPARGGHGGLPQEYPVERPEDPDHYRNWPMYHAPTVLRRWIHDLLDLELIPSSVDGEYWNFSSDINGQVIGKVLRRYGWPAEFREEDWARDSEQIIRAAHDVEERYEKSFDPHKFGRDREEVLSQWKKNPGMIPYVGLDLSE